MTEQPETRMVAVDGTADVTFYELRRGTSDDLHPLVLGRYLDLTDALDHGQDEFRDQYGTVDRLTWYPADDTETRYDLHVTDLGDELQTEWHIVTDAISAAYDPDAEG
jgi:hypothetical protein